MFPSTIFLAVRMIPKSTDKRHSLRDAAFSMDRDALTISFLLLSGMYTTIPMVKEGFNDFFDILYWNIGYIPAKEGYIMIRLKELRERRRMSQVFLGMELGMNQNTISRYETGTREPSNAELIIIADYFDVSIDYLLGRTDNPQMNR